MYLMITSSISIRVVAKLKHEEALAFSFSDSLQNCITEQEFQLSKF